MATRKARIAFSLKRFRGFLNSLRRSKRAMFGVIILVVAILVAVGAPLLTPYDPINSKLLSSNYAAPSWAKYLPGGEGYSENMVPLNDTQLSSPSVLKNFNISMSSSYDLTIKAYSFSFKLSLSIKGVMDGVLNFTTPHTFYGLSGSHSFRLNSVDLFGGKFKLWNTGNINQEITVSSAATLTAYYQTALPAPSPGKGTLSISAVFNNNLINASFSIAGRSGTFWTGVSGSQPITLDPATYLINGTYQSMTVNNVVEIVAANQITRDALLFGSTPVSASQNVENVVVQHSEIGGLNNPGSIAVLYEASSLPVNSSVVISIQKDFYYPYSGIPGETYFLGSLLLARIEGVSVQAQLYLKQNWLVPTITSSGVTFTNNVTRYYFGDFSRTDPYQRGLPETYTELNYTMGRFRTLGWIAPQKVPDWQSKGPGLTSIKQLFPRAGSYSFGIEVVIKKLSPNAEANVYIDSLNLQLQGTSFGLLGTDVQGRDVFTQLVYGTRISLVVGLLAAILSVVIGLVVGLVSAYVGGLVDEVLMRFTDALLVLPGLPLMIVLMAVLSSGQYNMGTFIIVIGFLGWMGFARLVRSQVLSLKERPYVEAAKAVGAGTPYILARHILPNVVALIYVTLALSVPSAIVSEAALSFLGFVDLSIMSWGRMLNAVSQPDIWWLIVPPGLAIAILSLSFILLGYALDEILNPKLRMRR